MYPVIATINTNSFNPISREYSHEERVKQIACSTAFYQPEILSFQEVLSGRLDDFREAYPEYSLYTPIGSFGPKTILAVTLIKRSFSGLVTIIDMGNCKTPNRVLILRVQTESDMPLYIINLHAICPIGMSSKHYDRVALSNALNECVYSFLEAHVNDSAIYLVGDMQDDSNGPFCSRIKRLGMFEPVSGLPTCTDNYYESSNIDHIFLNNHAKRVFGLKSLGIDNSLISSKVSDHIMLIANA